MSNSPLVTHVHYSPNCNVPRNHKIDTITIHHMACNMTVERCGNGFANPARQGSSNYGIDGLGHVGLYVDEANRAWTSSSPSNDNRAITIEVANDGGAPDWHVSDTAYYKLLDLVEDICRRNDIKELHYTGDKTGNMTLHKWFAATGCPGPYLESKMPEIAAEVNRRLNGGTPIVILPVNVTYQVYDLKTGKWLPNVENRNDYAGIGGHSFSAAKISTNMGNIYYKIHANDEWLPEVTNREDYAGLIGVAADAIMVRSDITNVHYQVELEDGTVLPAVSGYNEKDDNNGYAGIFGRNMAKLWVWADPIRQEPEPEPEPEPVPTPIPAPVVEDEKISYKVFDKTKKKWLPVVHDFNSGKDDGYAGNLGNPITGFMIKDDDENDLEYGVGLVGAGWLGIVNGYNEKDYMNGYAGRQDLVNSPAIDRVMIRSKSGRRCEYQAAIIKDGKTKWLPPVDGFNRADDENGYAGLTGYPICAVAVRVAGLQGAQASPVETSAESVAIPGAIVELAPEDPIIITPTPNEGLIDPIGEIEGEPVSAVGAYPNTDPETTPVAESSPSGESNPVPEGPAADEASQGFFARLLTLIFNFLKSLFGSK